MDTAVWVVLLLVVVLAGVGLLVRRERARAEQLARNLRALFEVSRQATANLDRQQVLEVVMQAVQDVMGYHMASILLRDENEPVLISSAISSNLRDRIPLGDRVPVGRGMVGTAAATGETQLANDITRNSKYLRAKGDWDPGSELSVPLKSAAGVLGVLDVEDERKGAFGPDDVQVLEALAEQLVVILDKARLFDDAQANLAQLGSLYELSQRLSQTQDARGLMRTALEVLAVHSHYRCTVALFDFDATGRPVRFYVPYYYQPGVGILEVNEYVAATEDPLNPLLDSGQTVAIDDVATDARVPDFLRQAQLEAGRPALALIPLVVGGRRIGNLVLSHTGAHTWTEPELRQFRSAANQIAAALDSARRFQQEKERTERLALIARVGQGIAARLNPDDLLAATVEVLHGQLGYDHVAVFLLSGESDDGWLVQRARASRWPPIDTSTYRQSVRQGILGAAATRRAPELVNEVAADPRYIPVPGSEVRAELAVPILLGGRLLGVLDVAGTAPFGEDDVTGLVIMADQLAVALENAALYERAQTVGVLEERQRLARDLHDSVTQLVFSLTLIAQSVGAAYRRDPVEGERRIARVVELSQQSLAEMRALLAELRPAGPVPNGLVPALQKHFERVQSREKLAIEFDPASYAAHARDYEEALYRIVQEALNNVIKHARASRVTVRLAQPDGQVCLTIADDGLGFDPAAAPAPGRDGGLGLVGIRERVDHLGGTFNIESAPGQGTRVAVVLPA
ncbi:MAG: GAF domain-containing protein [Anaerolineales bacterium]